MYHFKNIKREVERLPSLFKKRMVTTLNLMDAYVTKVLSKPRHVKMYGTEWWEVEVVAIDMGERLEQETLTFKTKEEAEEVKVGYIFQH